MKILLRTMILSGVFLVCACEQTQEMSGETPATQVQELELQQTDGRQVLSIHPKFGTLFGADEPALENADHARVMAVTLEMEGDRKAILDGLQDAKFLPDGSILAVTRSGDLVHIQNGETISLENNVSGPLSLAGDSVAYLIGEMGAYVPVVRNLATGARSEVASELAPGWQVALSESGKEMLFVSAHTNETTLVKVSVPAMTVLEETKVEVVPVGPAAPVWRGDIFLFESEEGLVRFHLPTQTWTSLGGNRPLVATDGQIFVHDNGLRDISEVVR